MVLDIDRHQRRPGGCVYVVFLEIEEIEMKLEKGVEIRFDSNRGSR